MVDSKIILVMPFLCLKYQSTIPLILGFPNNYDLKT